jgi:CHRD domain-containing protein
MFRHARVVLAIGILLTATAAGSGVAATGDGPTIGNSLQVPLVGYQETPLALSTTGVGEFRVQVSGDEQEISYELSYQDLEASVTQAHIHFGARAQTGGISVFLCTNLGNGPAGTQLCPAAPATVTGVLRAADVVGPAGQGIAAGEFAELVAAVRSGTTYVNVHTTKYQGGEIRAQLDHHSH